MMGLLRPIWKTLLRIRLLIVGLLEIVGIPKFFSDHPDSAARVRDIRAAAADLGCGTTLGDQSDWAAFQQSLPAASATSKDD